MTNLTRLALLAVWLGIPGLALAVNQDGSRLSNSNTAEIANETSSGVGSVIHSERFLICDGQHRDNSNPKCYGGNAQCTASTVPKACCTGAGTGTCAFDLENRTASATTLGLPDELTLSFELATNCTGATTITLQGANNDNAPSPLYNYGAALALPAAGLGNFITVTNAWSHRYVMVLVTNSINDCTDVEAILTLKWHEQN